MAALGIAILLLAISCTPPIALAARPAEMESMESGKIELVSETEHQDMKTGCSLDSELNELKDGQEGNLKDKMEAVFATLAELAETNEGLCDDSKTLRAGIAAATARMKTEIQTAFDQAKRNLEHAIDLEQAKAQLAAAIAERNIVKMRVALAKGDAAPLPPDDDTVKLGRKTLREEMAKESAEAALQSAIAERSIGNLQEALKAENCRSCDAALVKQGQAVLAEETAKIRNGDKVFLKLKSSDNIHIQTSKESGGNGLWYSSVQMGKTTSAKIPLEVKIVDSNGALVPGTEPVVSGHIVKLRNTLITSGTAFIYSTITGWAGYASPDTPWTLDGNKDQRWRIKRASAGYLSVGDEIELQEQHSDYFLCGNKEKTWGSDSYYVEVVSKAYRAGNAQASYTWIVERA